METDFVGAPHTQMELRRSYNSQDSTASAFGAGWHSSYHRSLSQPNSTTATVTRADGRVDTFTLNAGVWQADPDVTSRLTAVLAGPGGQQTGWKLVTADDSTESYTLAGQLTSITTRAGLVTTLSYDATGHLTKVTGPFGHTLTFASNMNGLISQVTVPAGGVYKYVYDTHNNLTSVTYADNTVRQYVYENTSFPNALTGIIDELGTRFATYAYDTQGRATSTQHAGGAELTTVAYNSDGTATATDARGNAHGYNFTTQFSLVKPTAVTGTPVPTAGGKAFTYDANGFVASKTDFDGNVTTYTHDARGLELSRTEASGTPQARTLTTTWHPTFHLPTQITEPNRVTGLTYDTKGNLLQKTITAGSLPRTWKYTYNANGQVLTVDGPRTDVQDVTRFTYDSKGDVATITDAVGHVTSITSYDADGRPLTIKDPNGLVTTLTYTSRGLIKSRAAGTEVTSYAYDAAENLIKVTLPDGSALTYAYDQAHRLTGIQDALGNLIAYTLDAAGNRVKEQVFDPSNVLKQTRSHVYDAVNRLAQDIGAQNQTTTYGYDNNGNLTSTTDPLNHATKNAYDALNRLVQATDPNNGLTTYGYDANDQLTGVTDPRGLATTYAHDGLGDLTAQQSPDAGTTKNTSYDAAGNLLKSTNARGNTTTSSYDALNRLTQVIFADGKTLIYQYDQGTNGIGHLTTMTDPSGTTTWSYDPHGRVLQKQQKTGAVLLTTKMSYDAVGRLASTTYPSGTVVTYAYDGAGRVSSVALNGVTLLGSLKYQPFGPVASWVEGNDALSSRSFDLDGRIAKMTVSGSASPSGGDALTLTRDAAGRITGSTTTGVTAKSFGYDVLDRLTSYTSGILTLTLGYDTDSNRQTLKTVQGTMSTTSAYTYATASNALLSRVTGAVTQKNTYDANGNLTGDGTTSYLYGANNRLMQSSAQAVPTNYALNGVGQRVSKSGSHVLPNSAVNFLYDEGGHLLGEYDAAGHVIEETVWLGDLPVSVLTAGAHYFVNPDQLGAPRSVTLASGKALWTWDHDPFGNGAPNQNPNGLGNFVYNLRFPGQYFDAETGLSYNMARDYDPTLGRYIQSDPIGLNGGINTYAYVGANPITRVDWSGLVEAGSIECLEDSSACLGPSIPGRLAVSGGGEAYNEVPILPPSAAAVQGGQCVVNEVPSTLARVIPGEGPFPTLGPPGKADVFVTSAEHIKGMSPSEIARRLTIESSNTYTIYEFPTPPGVASPVFRSDPGFSGGGRTLGGAPEFVIPNGPIPSGATIRIIGAQ